MEGRTIIERIQILSHSALVSKSIDLFLGADSQNYDDPDYKKAQYLSIGKVSLLDPSNAALKGRQFQTIELHGNDKLKVNFVKLSLRPNHMHKANEFNQVGLMGISIFGQMKSASQSRRGSRTDEFLAVPRRQDLAFLMYTDKDIAEV